MGHGASVLAIKSAASKTPTFCPSSRRSSGFCLFAKQRSFVFLYLDPLTLTSISVSSTFTRKRLFSSVLSVFPSFPPDLGYSEATRGGKQIPRVYINCQGREFACSHFGVGGFWKASGFAPDASKCSGLFDRRAFLCLIWVINQLN